MKNEEEETRVHLATRSELSFDPRKNIKQRLPLRHLLFLFDLLARGLHSPLPLLSPQP
jgi:hypothetical protein